jgi:predicted Zn-dependent peptidase
LIDFAPDAVKLLATVLRQPTFPATELERVRANFLRRLSVELSNPGAVASQAFSKVVYGEAHPYGRVYPTEAELKSYTLDGIKAFYKANLGARRTHLYVAGRFDSSIKKTIATAFEGWEAGPEPKHDPPKVQPKYSFTLLDRPGAHQSVLRIGLPVAATANSADYIPFQVTDSILGGSFGSRITSNIREQKGYTYSPHSMFQTRYKNASWLEAADVTTKVTAESIKEIFFEVDRMRKDPPSEAELKGIQNYMSGIFVLRNSSPSGIINQLSFVDLHGLPADYLKTYVQKVNAVSRGDVQRIAESYLDPKKMTVVVVGDKSVIGESLKPYEEPKE